jgi:SAM-dependent methyltransferase
MVVDFCAGAGGKTLALGAMMRSTGRLYAFDVSEKRLLKMRPRVARSGLSNVHPVLIDSENDIKVKRLAGKVDRVLVDAPCSGLGTLRRNPDLKWRQTPKAVDELVAKQRSILAGAARLVKPGGRLVYATCSLLDAENRGVIDDFLASHPEFVHLPANELLAAARVDLDTGIDLELRPDVHGTDGFYAAVMERRVAPVAGTVASRRANRSRTDGRRRGRRADACRVKCAAHALRNALCGSLGNAPGNVTAGPGRHGAARRRQGRDRLCPVGRRGTTGHGPDRRCPAGRLRAGPCS